MKSFKVYLPSNACQAAFPRNKPTDYSTRFDNPIVLDGNWEVGVERIAYSSHINDEEEHADIRFKTTADKFIPVNDLYPYKFKISKKGEWLGFEGIVPSEFEKDATGK